MHFDKHDLSIWLIVNKYRISEFIEHDQLKNVSPVHRVQKCLKKKKQQQTLTLILWTQG